MDATYFYADIKHSFSFEEIRAALFNEYFMKIGEITKGESNNGIFSEVSGGFERLVVHTDILAAYRGGREAAKSLDIIDLTDEKISDAKQLKVKIDRRKLTPNRRASSEQDFIKAALKLTSEQSSADT